MKIGRYEYGYWFLMIVLMMLIVPFLRIFPNIPEWVFITIFTILLLGSQRLYSVWFLRHSCETHLSQWITRLGFSYKVSGVITPSAHIQGICGGRSVHIELHHGSKQQFSLISYQVENLKGENITLSKRGGVSKLFQRVENGSDWFFDHEFSIKPSDSVVLLDVSSRNQLAQIQSSFEVIDTLGLDKDKVLLSYRGLLTDEIKLNAALDAVLLFANAIG